MTTTIDYGPQTEQITALIEKAATITPEQAQRLSATARDAAWAAAWAAARDAAWAAAALVVRDLVSVEHYTTLTAPWASVMGPVHPDDPPQE
jgi:hypothetical protein